MLRRISKRATGLNLLPLSRQLHSRISDLSPSSPQGPARTLNKPDNRTPPSFLSRTSSAQIKALTELHTITDPQSFSSQLSASSLPDEELPYPGTSRYNRSTPSFYDVTVEKYAELPHRSLTLKQLLQFGEQAHGDSNFIIRSARFVQREMPVRLAKRLMDLQFLPHIVVTNPHMAQVYQSYRKAFDLLRCFPRVNSADDNQRFTHLLLSLVEESSPLLDIIARGVKECYRRPLVGRQLDMDSFLDNMLRSRISRRVICEQHIGIQQNKPGFIGIICTELLVRDAVAKAATQCTEICFQTYGVSPRFSVRGDIDTSLPYISAHLDYILFEIFKNASRAVVEHWMAKGQMVGRRVTSDALPPVVVTICKGKTDVTIRVSDQGGGIPEDQVPLIWSYGYTTVDDMLPIGANSATGMWAESKSSMAGLGFGLPLSRVHAQYLGGDLRLVSIPDYGTDVYIRVHRLGDHAESFEI